MTPNMTMSVSFLMCAIFSCVCGLQMQPTNISAVGGLAEAGPLRVRYAAIAYDKTYIQETMLPQIASSVCKLEANLAPSLPVKYTIYTSSLSDAPLKNLFIVKFPDVVPRISFLNLDEDPNDKIRMARYAALHLDSVNLASVRRMLADVHLPTTEGRLFLGTDISFLKRPDDFLKKSQRHQVVYMVDDYKEMWRGQTYKIAAYDGPQCAGLLGDLFYVAAGTKIAEEDAHQALNFYMDLPHDPPRLAPACKICDNISNGLHGLDQFAWAMVLGKISNGQCVALDSSKYHNRHERVDLEAIHDKKIRCAVAKDLRRTFNEAHLREGS